MIRRTLFQWTLFTLMVAWISSASNVKLQDGGYQGLVVAVSDDAVVKLEEDIIDAIQELFTKTSAKLLAATKNRAFIRSITILVPATWKGNYEPATLETYEDADVRIDNANPFYGDKPYTLQTGLCGELGKYIHLTPDFLWHIDGKSKIFGDPGRQLVEEWFRYRYGTLDEISNTRDPQYPVLLTKNVVVLSKICENRKLTDLFWDTNSNCLCGFGLENLLYEHCRFIDVEVNELQETKSLPSSQETSEFCKSLETADHNHNKPSDYNNLCRGETPIEVMLSSSDFVNKSKKADPNLSTIPTFQVVQQRKEIAFIFVLDISRSMDSDTPKRITVLNEAVRRWLNFDFTLGNYVGVISFAHSASIVKPIVLVNSEKERKNVMDAIPNSVIQTSGTCIGCGLREAVAILPKTLRSIIILVTDGEENEAPFINDVLPEVIAANVTVVTLAVTDAADGHLEELASLTKGRSFFIKSSFPASALTSALEEISDYQRNRPQLPVQVFSKEHSGNTSAYDGHFIIDSTLGNDLNIKIIYNNREDINNVSIVSPSKTLLLTDSDDNLALKIISFRFLLLDPGIYNYSLSMRNENKSQKVFVSVRSSPVSQTNQPVTVRCWMKLRKYFNGVVLSVYAEIKKGYVPVLNTIVRARINRPNNASDVELILLDNGNGAPDITSDDGVYSRYFSSFSGKGRYSVQIKVINHGKAVIEELPLQTLKSPPENICGIPVSEVSKFSSLEPFQRFTTCGCFHIAENISEETDVIPPSPIRDLQVVEVSVTERTITFRWTSPGDNLDEGTVNQYDMRMASAFQSIFRNFSETEKLDCSNIVPSTAGDIVTFILEINDFMKESIYYFAVKAGDKMNNWSELSNIVQVYIPYPPSAVNRHTTTYSVVIVIIIVVVILIISFVVYKYRYRRRIRSLI